MPDLMHKKRTCLAKGQIHYVCKRMDRSSHDAVMNSDSAAEALKLNPYTKPAERLRWARLTTLKWGFIYSKPSVVRMIANQLRNTVEK